MKLLIIKNICVQFSPPPLWKLLEQVLKACRSGRKWSETIVVQSKNPKLLRTDTGDI